MLVVQTQDECNAAKDVMTVHDEGKCPQGKPQADAVVLEVPVVDENQTWLEKQQCEGLDGLVALGEVRQAEVNHRWEEDNCVGHESGGAHEKLGLLVLNPAGRAEVDHPRVELLCSVFIKKVTMRLIFIFL